MLNQIILTLSSCVDSMQLNLFDFGLEKPEFEQVLTSRFQSVDTPWNVNHALNLLADDHLLLSQHVQLVSQEMWPGRNGRKETDFK